MITRNKIIACTRQLIRISLIWWLILSTYTVYGLTLLSLTGTLLAVFILVIINMR